MTGTSDAADPVVVDGCSGQQPPVGDRDEQLLDEHPDLEPAEMDADAGVGTVAEPDVGIRTPVEPDRARVFEHRPVVIGAREVEQHDLARHAPSPTPRRRRAPSTRSIRASGVRKRMSSSMAVGIRAGSPASRARSSG